MMKTNDHAGVEISLPHLSVVALQRNRLRCHRQTPAGVKKSPLLPGEGQGEGVSFRNNPLMIKKTQKKKQEIISLPCVAK